MGHDKFYLQTLYLNKRFHVILHGLRWGRFPSPLRKVELKGTSRHIPRMVVDVVRVAKSLHFITG